MGILIHELVSDVDVPRVCLLAGRRCLDLLQLRQHPISEADQRECHTDRLLWRPTNFWRGVVPLCPNTYGTKARRHGSRSLFRIGDVNLNAELIVTPEQ